MIGETRLKKKKSMTKENRLQARRMAFIYKNGIQKKTAETA